ncbi:MAG: hydrogenase nickel incorporation protein HypB [Desulfobacterales bacterium]|nr:hydrogenase nickel incorporation protein HypB [Desulfobacterales bacterium]
MEIKVVKKVLDANDAAAAKNRKFFKEKGIFVVNIMSSPGSGKTSVLEKAIAKINSQIKCAVIVGDVCTTNDAERLAKAKAPVVQVNTDEFGGDCHLAAHVIEKALDEFDLNNLDLIIVENVGNLVCPAEFDIGENIKGVVLSTTEGEDKPLKYPLMFRICDFALLNKIDLLPYLDFDKNKAIQNIYQVNPNIKLFEVSAKTEEGLDDWIKWLIEKVGETTQR